MDSRESSSRTLQPTSASYQSNHERVESQSMRVNTQLSKALRRYLLNTREAKMYTRNKEIEKFTHPSPQTNKLNTYGKMAAGAVASHKDLVVGEATQHPHKRCSHLTNHLRHRACRTWSVSRQWKLESLKCRSTEFPNNRR